MAWYTNYIWAVSIGINLFNGFLIFRSSRERIYQKPELEPGYKKIFFYVTVYMNIPWAIMGIGNLTGTSSISDYAPINKNNPVVILAHLSMVIILTLTARWIYFGKGAEFIEEHPARYSLNDISYMLNLTAKQVKIIFGIAFITALSLISIVWIYN